MRDDLLKRLFEDFPDLYCHFLYLVSSWSVFFQCGDGWEPLLRRLSERITRIVQSLPLKSSTSVDKCSISDETSTEGGQYAGLTAQSFSVNEVMAPRGLGFYMDRSTHEIDLAIKDAKEESLTTCETCGRPGKITDWWFVACDDHKCDKEEAIEFDA